MDDADVTVIMNQFITPTRPAGQTIEPIAVTTPSELWPLTGLFRLLGRLLGPPSIFGPGGAGWPDEPLWKFSGLFDLTFDQSVQTGLADLETAMTEHGNDNLVIYGYSQGAMIANLEQRKLAEQYPAGTPPNIDFVLSEDPNLPNGGLWPASRASTFRSSISRSTAPHRPTPNFTRSPSPGNTTVSPISRCIRSTWWPT